VGAAGSTGRGEACIKACGAFLTVENMRRGMSPTDAALETLRRVVATTEEQYTDERGRATFGLNFYAVNKNGVWGAASMWGGAERTPRYAVWDGETAQHFDCAVLFERDR
jgi:N4-(beta-N-acetylglucosaminyl)-L-asparaginase